MEFIKRRSINEKFENQKGKIGGINEEETRKRYPQNLLHKLSCQLL